MTKLGEPLHEVAYPVHQNRKLYIVLDSQERKELVKFDSGDDVTTKLKNIFAAHVSDLTRNNEFPIAEAIAETRSFPVENGLQNADDNGQKTYLGTFRKAGEVADSATRIFNNLSSGDNLGSDFGIKKGKQNSTSPTGDEVYRDIDQNLGNSDVAKRIHRVMLKENNYNEENPYIISGKRDDILVLGTIENGLGKKTIASEIHDGAQITIKDMKKLALLTMLQATGEVVQPNFKDPNALDQLTSIGTAVSMAPGITRMGGKVEVSRFAPSNVIKAIKPNHLKKDNTNFLDDNSMLSYGNTNSYFVPFDGLFNVPSVTSAAIMMAVVSGILKSFGAFKLITPTSVALKPAGIPASRRRWLGSYKGKDINTSVNITPPQLLDIVPTENSFFACLDKGVTVFFNGDSNNPAAASTANLAKIHGYYNVVLRNVIRSINLLVTPTAENLIQGKGNGYSDINEIRNTIDPYTNVKKFNNSSLMKFVNILVTIGDRVLQAESSKEAAGFLGDLTANLTDSDIDDIAEDLRLRINNEDINGINPAVLIGKNRLNNFGGTLAISNTSLKSLFLMPNKLLDGAHAFGSQVNINGAKTKLQEKNIVISDENQLESGRIKQSIVKEMEDYLEKDYLPFYIHDIRTNEIISFHAFLDNLTENLSADYNETEAYGRVGSVYTYKNTKRDIGLTFKMLATNDSDFDQMWYKINRLAAMLYPQWTEGRRISFGSSNKFIQPFSQLPGASPLVRLRLGDLWKSNYSKFAAARLFGLADGLGAQGAFNVNSQAAQQEATRSRQLEDGIRINADRIFQEQSVHNFTSIQDMYMLAGGSGPCPAYPPATQGRQYQSLSPTTDIRVRVIARDVAPPPPHDADFVNTWFLITPVNPSDVPQARQAQGRNHAVPGATTGAQYLVSSAQLKADRSLIVEQLRGQQSADTTPVTGNDPSDISDFFNDGSTGNQANSNPILKAFETTRGKGLAGFIKKMGMNYDEKVTWATHKGNGRAPVLVTINLEFAPIYDIQPGLAANGSMTAPIWNVGDIMGAYTDQEALTNDSNLVQQAKSAFGNRR